MFEQKVQEARDIIRRVHISKEQENNVPDLEKVSGTELTAWFLATEKIVIYSFGLDSSEIQRYQTLWNSKSELIDKLIARGDSKWEFTYWIDLFQLMIGLLTEFEAKYSDSQSQKRPNYNFHGHQLFVNSFVQQPEVTMGDKYEVGQAGAVGPHAYAHDITFNQIWARSGDTFDLPTLTSELSVLRAALKTEATEPEHDAAVGAVASAETEAKKGNGPKALEYLSKAGQWTLDVATKIGVTVAAAAVKEALGIK